MLLDAGRDVYAVDLRGHGASEKPHDPQFYGEKRMSQDFIELWDSLVVDDVDLVGYSMGSVVALIAASSDRRIRNLVLGGIGRYQLEYDGGPLPHFDSDGSATALSADDPNLITDPDLRSFRDGVDDSDNDRLALAAHLRVFHREPFNFAQISATTLVIAGEDDVLSPDPQLLANAIPDGSARTVPGDHSSAKTTSAFTRAVAAFLA